MKLGMCSIRFSVRIPANPATQWLDPDIARHKSSCKLSFLCFCLLFLAMFLKFIRRSPDYTIIRPDMDIRPIPTRMQEYKCLQGGQHDRGGQGRAGGRSRGEQTDT